MYKKKLSLKGMLIVFKQQKVYNYVVDKQFSNTMHLIILFLEVMEGEEVEVEKDNLGFLLVTETSI